MVSPQQMWPGRVHSSSVPAGQGWRMAQLPEASPQLTPQKLLEVAVAYRCLEEEW